MRIPAALILSLALSLSFGIGKPMKAIAPAGHPFSKSLFRNLPATPEALMQRAVACLNRGDTAGFYNLGVTREEYLALYPYLDRADTVNHDDRDFRMGFFLMDNRKMIIRLFQERGGSGLEFSRLAFLAQPRSQGPFAFNEGFLAWVKKDSQETELLIAKSLIYVEGGWKFWGLKSD